jgi:hypothetical protein
MNNNQFNYKFIRINDDNYIRPKKTISDLMQTQNNVEQQLEDYQEISNEELDQLPLGIHVRYIGYNKKTAGEAFRFGGSLKKINPDYLVLIGKNNLTFSVQRYSKNKNNEIIHKTRFFIKDKDIDKINESNQELIQNQQIIDQQNEIIHKQKREIEKLKRKLNNNN